MKPSSIQRVRTIAFFSAGAFAILTGLACSSGARAAGSKCSATSQCQSGLFCLPGTGTCAEVACTKASDCPEGAACNNGACGSAAKNNNGDALPTISGATIDPTSSTLTIFGTNLAAVTSIQLGGGSLTSPVALTPSAATASRVLALVENSFPLVVGQTYNLVVATAGAASAPAAIAFTIPDASVTLPMLNASTCASGDVLTVASGAWNCASPSITSLPLSGGTMSGGITFSAPPTKDLFIAPIDFLPLGGASPLVAAGTFIGVTNGSGTYAASIHLPDNALITNVACSVINAVNYNPITPVLSATTVSLYAFSTANTFSSIQCSAQGTPAVVAPMTLSLTNPTSAGAPCGTPINNTIPTFPGSFVGYFLNFAETSTNGGITEFFGCDVSYTAAPTLP